MNAFQDVEWKTIFREELHTDKSGNRYKTAHYITNASDIPFSFDEWAKNCMGRTVISSIVDIYDYCSKRLTRPLNKQLVLNAATRLELDPGFVNIADKMASYYILQLLATIPKQDAWKMWSKIPQTIALLKDEIFCLCVVSLHPVLYGKLHPIGRNNRRVCLEAIALWDLPKYSVLQFCHPRAMQTFKNQIITQHEIGLEIQAHKKVDQQYWVFDDWSVVNRVIGKPGQRRWFELQYAGPTAIKWISQQRIKHGSSLEPIKPFLQKNIYN